MQKSRKCPGQDDLVSNLSFLFRSCATKTRIVVEVNLVSFENHAPPGPGMATLARQTKLSRMQIGDIGEV